MIDVLMYVFEHYMQGSSDVLISEDQLTAELRQHGYLELDIKNALRWIETLTDERHFPLVLQTSQGMPRYYTDSECKQIPSECRSFLMYLEEANVLDEVTREIVIDRALALGYEELTLGRLKWVVLMVLFSLPEKNSALDWMQDFVLHYDHQQTH